MSHIPTQYQSLLHNLHCQYNQQFKQPNLQTRYIILLLAELFCDSSTSEISEQRKLNLIQYTLLQMLSLIHICTKI